MRSQHLSLTLFLDFVLATGSERATVARSHHRAAHDIYRMLKAGLVRLVAGEITPEALMVCLAGASERMRHPRRIAALEKRLAHTLAWLEAQRLRTYEARQAAALPAPFGELAIDQGLVIAVNPEIAVMIKDEPHVLKLYLREEPLTQARVRMTCGILALALDGIAPAGSRYGVLDLITGKMHLVRDGKLLGRAGLVARADGLSYAALLHETSLAA